MKTLNFYSKPNTQLRDGEKNSLNCCYIGKDVFLSMMSVKCECEGRG